MGAVKVERTSSQSPHSAMNVEMSSFSDYVQKAAMAPAELPLVHTTEYFRLAAIRMSNTLQATACKIFKEPLLYFFYGRPAYRDTSQTLPTRDIGFYPICFVFRPDTIGKKAKRLYPFDTGASQSGLYEPAIKGADAIADYSVLAAAESARKIVHCFFDTDEQYLSNKPKPGLSFSPTENAAKSYYDLINGGGDPKCDDRYSAVEIQIADSVDVSLDIMAVALPTCFLEDAELARTVLKVWGAEPLTYNADIGMRPIEFHGVIRQKIREFYQRAGLL
jgi:hypothetical protein